MDSDTSAWTQLALNVREIKAEQNTYVSADDFDDWYFATDPLEMVTEYKRRLRYEMANTARLRAELFQLRYQVTDEPGMVKRLFQEMKTIRDLQTELKHLRSLPMLPPSPYHTHCPHHGCNRTLRILCYRTFCCPHHGSVPTVQDSPYHRCPHHG